MALAPEKAPYLFTVAEYLTFERAADERHEYLDGVIYAMAGESPNHGRICTNLTMSLGTQLLGKSLRGVQQRYQGALRPGPGAHPHGTVVVPGPRDRLWAGAVSRPVPGCAAQSQDAGRGALPLHDAV